MRTLPIVGVGLLMLVLLPSSTLAKGTDASIFTAKRQAAVFDQPNGRQAIGALAAGKAYPLLKIGGPGNNWCKVQVSEGPGWIECSAGVLGASAGGPADAGADFAYYVLTLSWSPAFCAQHGKQSPEQCDGPKGYGFVVHGLWPQKDPKGWPERCARQGEVGEAIAREMLAIMPSTRLMEHEWETHGTCSGLAPAEYFALIRSAREKIHIPAKLVEPKKPITASGAEIEKMFIEENAGLGREMIAVMCKKFVNEVRVCFDKSLGFRKCGSDVRTQCKGKAIFPPVR